MADNILEPSANQLYKESNSSLSFAEWIQREKDKGVYIKNALLEEVKPKSTPETTKNLASAKFDFGVPKWVLLTGAVVIVSALLYKKYGK